jgi:hypothetical protein
MSMRRIEEIFARHREEYVIRRIEEIFARHREECQ